MDKYLILEFPTQEEAGACLTAINALAAQWWASQGYSVDGNELIGKNAKTGKEEPEKTRTVSWAEIQESPDKTWFFPSLSNDQRFTDWKQNLADFGFTAIGTEKEYPTEWLEPEEELQQRRIAHKRYKQ